MATVTEPELIKKRLVSKKKKNKKKKQTSSKKGDKQKKVGNVTINNSVSSSTNASKGGSGNGRMSSSGNKRKADQNFQQHHVKPTGPTFNFQMPQQQPMYAQPVEPPQTFKHALTNDMSFTSPQRDPSNTYQSQNERQRNNFVSDMENIDFQKQQLKIAKKTHEEDVAQFNAEKLNHIESGILQFEFEEGYKKWVDENYNKFDSGYGVNNPDNSTLSQSTATVSKFNKNESLHSLRGDDESNQNNFETSSSDNMKLADLTGDEGERLSDKIFLDDPIDPEDIQTYTFEHYITSGHKYDTPIKEEKFSSLKHKSIVNIHPFSTVIPTTDEADLSSSFVNGGNSTYNAQLQNDILLHSYTPIQSDKKLHSGNSPIVNIPLSTSLAEDTIETDPLVPTVDNALILFPNKHIGNRKERREHMQRPFDPTIGYIPLKDDDTKGDALGNIVNKPASTIEEHLPNWNINSSFSNLYSTLWPGGNNTV